jgi:RNA polymerase sigma-70 factor (ECF subfamily)
VSTSTGSLAREQELLATARAGDESAFASVVNPYRGELHAHCYRMLGSVHDAEDALQETLLRAWRAIGRFEGRSSLRSWLYTIATNASLNLIARRPKRVLPIDYGPPTDPHIGPGEPIVESIWVEPYPDEQIGIEDGLASPEASYEMRESVELAFVAALQHLVPNQRAVLILREVLGFSAKEVADTLQTSVASVNSLLQRARKSVDERLPDPSQQLTLRAIGDTRLKELVNDYVNAWEQGDVQTVVNMLTEDATFAMPPLASWFSGREQIRQFLATFAVGMWRWKGLPAHANGQAALAFYVWDEDEACHLPFALNLLSFRGEQIRDVTAFIVRSTDSPDTESYVRFTEEPTDTQRLQTAFGRFELPARLP